MKTKIVALVACVFVFAAQGVDEYVRARYMRVDKLGEAQTLTFSSADACRPGEYRHPLKKYPQKGQITPERIADPWWEWDLKECRPVVLVYVNALKQGSHAFDLYGARLILMDDNRRVVWHQTIWNVGGQISFDISPRYSLTDLLGQVLPETPMREGLVSAPPPPPVKDLRRAIAKKLYNPAAMARAIEAYAVKHPDLFPDRDDLLKEAQAAAASPDNAAADALSRKVFFRLPQMKAFREILAIWRGDQNSLGLPQNWQGNTSVPVAGYTNGLVRVAVDPQTRQEPFGQTLFASDAFVGDVALDFDAEKVAFATRKLNLPPAIATNLTTRGKSVELIGGAGFCVAEMRLDEPGRLVELTPTNRWDIDYYDPMYLPDGRMFLVGTVGYQGVPCVSGNDFVGNLILRYADGRLRRLSFDQDNNWCPVMLQNGRCLYLRWEYTDSAHYFARILMTMNPDGSDQQEFYGSNSYWPNSMFYARPLPGSSTKFMAVVTGHHGVPRKGELVLFDVAKGRREADGAVQQLPGWGKPANKRTVDRLVNNCKQFFLHPYPVSDEMALVSMQDYAVAKHFFIALVDIYDNQYPILVDEDDRLNWLQPIPLMKQPHPFEVVQRVDESKTNCIVNVVSVYNGPGLEGLPVGTVKKLRVFYYEYTPRKTRYGIGGHYLIGMEGPWDPRVMLGEVDVEPDGSCMFEAPANLPLVLQPLDANGKHLQEMRSWCAGMPGEFLSCIGCHQMQNYASPNQRTIASRKPPQQIQPWYGPRREFSFDREVANVIERRCSGCHDGNPAKKNVLGQPIPKLNGKPREIYDNLHPYVRRNGPEGDYHLLTPLEFHADTSELWQRLEKGHHGVVLTDEEKSRILTWMNINVPFWGTWGEIEKADKRILSKRRELEREVANLHFDPDVIVNPYHPVAFEPPAGKKPSLPPDGTVAPVVATPVSGETQTLDLGNGQQIVLRRIPAGRFAMGSWRETPMERPVTEVTIDKPFWMGETEISMAQLRAFDKTFDNGVYDMHCKDQVNRGYYMNDDPEFGRPENVNLPAIRVSWEKAQAFCDWLSKKTGRKVRLPSEAQWEWACRAGTTTPLSFGGYDADFGPFANLAGSNRVELAVKGINPKPIPNPPKELDWELRDSRFEDGYLHLAPVGTFRPNAWGLKDMHGNVAEWTRSDYVPYPYTGSEGQSDRKAVRGGSFNDRQLKATSAWRWGYPKWMRPFDVGFRIVVED